MRSVAATITGVSRNLVPAGDLVCTEVGADDEMCGLSAEWVALEGPIYSTVALPRCIAHAVAASRALCRIWPINSSRVRRRSEKIADGCPMALLMTSQRHC